MADKRKLQGEIDRCLKKVTEGVETFDDIWQKVQSAANANQKEKYEADLKKEIKKLQRLRDQIKTWLTSNDIKDKRPLIENRKIIESRMERFKVIERETKTKAYSKEGLGLAAKVDPAQKEKEEIRQWLTERIDQLQMQIDQFESEIETIHSSTKRKKLDRDKQDRVDELTEWVERHKFHMQKAETIMRMLDNCSIEAEDVKTIQEDLNYYVESNQEPDFAENELMYDDLNLDDGTGIVGTGNTLHYGTNEDEESSLASSPTSSGPLSPKILTTSGNKTSSSQINKDDSHPPSAELFEERRKGKTPSISSENSNEIPPSPRRPGPKSLTLNTTPNSNRTNNSKTGNTPTSLTGNGRTNSLGSAAGTIRTISSSPVISNMPPLGSNSPKTPRTSVVEPLVSAYAVAAAGNNSNSTHSSTEDNNTVDLTSPAGEISESNFIPSSSSVPAGSVTSSNNNNQQRSQGPSSLPSHHSRSNSISSLSPDAAPPTVDAQPTGSINSNNGGGVASTSQEAMVTVATSSGPSSQPSISPNLSSLTVSVNTSPNGSPPNYSSSVKMSPVQTTHPPQASITMTTVTSPSTQYFSSVLPAKTDDIITAATNNTVVPPVAIGVASAGGGLAYHKTNVDISRPSDVIFGSTSLSSLQLAGNPPTVVTSFPLQTSDSFSPSSLGSLGYIGGTPPSSSIDMYGFPSNVPPPPNADSMVTVETMSSLKEITAEAIVAHGLLQENKTQDLSEQNLRALLNPSQHTSRLDSSSLGLGSSNAIRRDISLQPLLGVAPLGPVSLGQDKVYQLKMLDSAFKHLPEPSDSEKVRPYLQRNPYHTPLYHHHHPPSHMDSYDFYQRLSIETLFFIFYYMEGTKAQYMAAKALKKLSWRFHTKYMTWFQRLEEPNTITDDYEMGTYIYFDYEKWAQRKKDGFTFEYRYLEDRDLL